MSRNEPLGESKPAHGEVPNRSRQLFESGFHCAESVLLAVAEHQGIKSDLIPKIATGFCGGIARTGNLCGAVSGAIMALNLAKGRTAPDQPVADNYAAVQKLLKKFDGRFGSTNCRDLIRCDLMTEEGRRYFKENHLIERCKLFTQEAAAMAVLVLSGPKAVA
jgi:C_GCAxxG_C_C family probable redox protein